MRMMVDFDFPLEPFNTLTKNGTVAQVIEKVLGDIKPEAVYFAARDGKRGGTMIVDIADASRVPSIAEPLFLAFNATVTINIVIGPEDLAKSGLDELGKRYA